MSWGRTLEGTREAWTAYRNTASDAQGRDVPMGEGVAMMRPIFVAPTMEEAQRIMRPVIETAMTYGAGKWARPTMIGKSEPLSDEDQADDWLDFLTKRGHTLVGTPEYVAEGIQKVAY